MQLALPLALLAFALALPAAGQDKKPAADAVTKEIADHRTMAQAHENAARCLEAGRSDKECHDQLVKDCKNVGIGKHCGMRHKH